MFDIIQIGYRTILIKRVKCNVPKNYLYELYKYSVIKCFFSGNMNGFLNAKFNLIRRFMMDDMVIV